MRRWGRWREGGVVGGRVGVGGMDERLLGTDEPRLVVEEIRLGRDESSAAPRRLPLAIERAGKSDGVQVPKVDEAQVPKDAEAR